MAEGPSAEALNDAFNGVRAVAASIPQEDKDSISEAIHGDDNVQRTMDRAAAAAAAGDAVANEDFGTIMAHCQRVVTEHVDPQVIQAAGEALRGIYEQSMRANPGMRAEQMHTALLESMLANLHGAVGAGPDLAIDDEQLADAHARISDALENKHTARIQQRVEIVPCGAASFKVVPKEGWRFKEQISGLTLHDVDEHGQCSLSLDTPDGRVDFGRTCIQMHTNWKGELRFEMGGNDAEDLVDQYVVRT